MTDVQPDLEKIAAIASEDVRVGYSSAVNLAIYEGEIFWSRFNAMVVSNSIIIAMIGFSATSDRNLIILNYGMPILGVILCVMWYLLMKRATDYFKYWTWSARELEQRLPSRMVETISRGAAFSAGKSVSLNFDDQLHPHQMSPASSVTSTQSLSLLVIYVFLAVYVAAFLQAFY